MKGEPRGSSIEGVAGSKGAHEFRVGGGGLGSTRPTLPNLKPEPKLEQGPVLAAG